MTPDISIVVPAYNVAAYIEATLRSALGQRGVAVEVIVVDDGSTDATAERVAPFLADRCVRLIRQENQGLPGARNTGIAAATGRYLGFLDGDDLWDEDKAAEHVALMDANPGIDLSYSWWRFIDESGQVVGRRDCAKPAERVPGGLSFEGLVLENFTGNGSTTVCRREALIRAGGFDPTLRSSCEDLDAWLRVAALREGNIGLVPRVLTSYRLHGGQMSRDWRRMLAGWETVIGKARAIAPERVARVEEEARARQEIYLAQVAYESGDYDSARRLGGRAWARAPRLLMRERRAWMVAGAVSAASLLPKPLHDRLATSVMRYRRGRRHADGGGGSIAAAPVPTLSPSPRAIGGGSGD